MDQRLAAAAEKIPWQEMFRQLHDLHKSNTKSLPPRLVKWMDAQRRRYKLYGVGRKKSVGIIKHRIAQLDSVGFDWHHGEEKRADHDPSPTVILPLSQNSPTRPSRHTERIVEPLREEEYSPQPIRRSKKKPQSRSSTGGNKEPMDRKELLNAGFPEQLFHMVNGASEKASHLLDWTADGSAFEIYDTKNIGNFIRQYFRHSNLSSLRRMLHYYSFSTANNVYRHPHFYRGNSLSNIKRRVVQKNDERNSTEEIITSVSRKKDKKVRRDSGADEEVSSPRKDKKQLLNAGFPEQLFNMVNGASERASHKMNWTADGSAFEIYDTKNVGSFIRQYFRHSNLSSLRRMLHLYSFSTANNVYRHPHFHRDSSLADIKRNLVKKTS